MIPEVIGPTPESKQDPQRGDEFSIRDKLRKISKERWGKDQPLCPQCGAEVFRPEDEVMYYCSNAACPAQVLARLELFTGRGTMDIRGIGEAMAALLLEKGLVKDVADIYSLKKEDLLKLERMGEKSADNLITAIEGSKNRSLARLIFALGIRHVGGEMAQTLAENFTDLDDLASASEERLMSIPAIGPKIAESIVTFFRQKENLDIIKRLKEAGVWPKAEVAEGANLALTGKEFVITGRLAAFSREEVEGRVMALGGTAKDNVTRNTAYLVVGEDPGGSKLARAQELGTPRIDEAEFLRLIGETG